MTMRPFLALALVPALVLAGCATTAPAPTTSTLIDPPDPMATPAYQAMGFNGTTWPSLTGTTVTILDHGAFGAFDEAKKLFENLTGATVEHVPADDAGSALQLAVKEKGSPTFDVIYGIDNILYAKAVQEGVFEPYRPLLSDRIDPQYVFMDKSDPWYATPVDHGYIAVNVDPRHPSLAGANITTLDDVRAHAGDLVTQDPRTSTPGLGFLLATIATYPENATYDWKDYWNDLFLNGVLITSGWTEAYEQHFSGGYGPDYGGLGDRPIVTSYTTSPAYEAYFGRAAQNLSVPLTAPNASFHQIETMGIVKGTKNLAAAQAWIEFTLTREFQDLVAPKMAVYPVTTGVSVEGTFGGVDPAPGTFEPAQFDALTLGANVERWVREWTDLCEAADCA